MPLDNYVLRSTQEGILLATNEEELKELEKARTLFFSAFIMDANKGKVIFEKRDMSPDYREELFEIKITSNKGINSIAESPEQNSGLRIREVYRGTWYISGEGKHNYAVCTKPNSLQQYL